MKHTIISILFVVVGITAYAQSYEWVKGIGGASNDTGISIGTDTLGNVYTIGYFTHIADLDPDTSTYSLSALYSPDSTEVQDIFISKLDAQGNFLWAKKIGGDYLDIPSSAIVDAAGNIYITGTCDAASFDFNPDSVVAHVYPGNTAYVCKLDANGDFIWVKGVASGSQCSPACIRVDSLGNTYISGRFLGVGDFNPTGGVYNLVANAWSTFLLKLNPSGNLIWVKPIYNTSSNGAKEEFCIDNAGNFYLTGIFNGLIDCNPGNGSYNLIATSGSESYFIKWNSNGDFVFAAQMDHVYVYSIQTDNLGNLYLVGDFVGTVDFDIGPNISHLTSSGIDDIFIVKWDNNFNFKWAKQIGANNPVSAPNEVGKSAAIDVNGCLYITGFFKGTIDFDPSIGFHTLAASPNNTSIFLLKLGPYGDFIWAQGINGSGDNRANTITLDNSGNVYTTGFITGVSDFDASANFNSPNLYGSNDVFMYKMAHCDMTSEVYNLSVCDSLTLNGQTYTTSGTYTQTLLNAEGCDSVLTLNLTINASPDPSVTQNGASLTANATNATYQWVDCNGNVAIVGETAQTFVATVNGNYAVIVTRTGCSDTSICYLVTGLAIEANDIRKDINIYPNPNDGTFYLQKTSSIPVSLTILNSLGQICYQKECITEITPCNLGNISAGLYYLSISTSTEKIYMKMKIK